MRLYSWVNMYLEGIHAGIQTQHACDGMTVKYYDRVTAGIKKMSMPNDDHKKLNMIMDWKRDHKVIQIFNGGYSSSLRERYKALTDYATKFCLPLGKFHESKDALDGALTAVCIIVPEQYYNRAARESGPESDVGSFWQLLHNCRHAR